MSISLDIRIAIVYTDSMLINQPTKRRKTWNPQSQSYSQKLNQPY